MLTPRFIRRPVLLWSALLCTVAWPKAAQAADDTKSGSQTAGFHHAVRKGTIEQADYLAHIEYLASDKLEGRGIGTEGIEQAAQYIAGVFQKAGLKPGGKDGSYFQEFDLKFWRKLTDETKLVFAAGDNQPQSLKLNVDFSPMPFGSAGDFEGEVVFAGYAISDGPDGYDDFAGIEAKDKVVLALRYEPRFMLEDPQNPERHTQYAAFNTKARCASDAGAKALLVVNPLREGQKDVLFEFARGGRGDFGIPMIHLTQKAADRLLKAGGLPDLAALQQQIETTRKPASAALHATTLQGKVAIESNGPIVKNVLGILPGKGPNANEFIIVGGHFDHLGKTAPMRSPNATPEIHNGADDNASGTAGVLEVARLLASGDPLNRSVLFMAFTAEESGLLGSAHFAREPTIDLDAAVTMVNMDMIGRLRQDRLQVGGMKTAPEFEEMVRRLGKQYGIQIEDGGGGRGPSDHTSFYNKNIPVLFAFTGLHRQYHQPDDDPPLINAAGGAKVAQMMADVVYEVSALPQRPTFVEDTRRENLFNPDGDRMADIRGGRRRGGERAGRSRAGDADAPATAGPAASVRLGILPDLDGKDGILISTVEDDTPASRAGLKPGDRIVRFGEATIKQARDLRQALAKVRNGDTVEAQVLRGGEPVTVKVVFGTPSVVELSKQGVNPHGEIGEKQPAMPTARLGVAPSYASGTTDGFAIEYVVEGGPAAKAGMRDSDVIVSIGDHKCTDVYSYMSAMSKFKPGDEVVVVVLREGRRLELKVKLEAAQARN